MKNNYNEKIKFGNSDFQDFNNDVAIYVLNTIQDDGKTKFNTIDMFEAEHLECINSWESISLLGDSIDYDRFMNKSNVTDADKSEVTGDLPSDVLHPVAHRYEVVGRDFMTNQPIYRAVPVEFANDFLKEDEMVNELPKEGLILKLYHSGDSLKVELKPVRDLIWDEREVFVPKVYQH
jgi:hypothetical protein